MDLRRGLAVNRWKPKGRDSVIAVVELNRFAYEPLDVGSLSQDRTSLSKIRVSLPWLTGSFFQMQSIPVKSLDSRTNTCRSPLTTSLTIKAIITLALFWFVVMLTGAVQLWLL